VYVDEAQDIFNAVLDILDEEENGCLHNFEDGICKTCGNLNPESLQALQVTKEDIDLVLGGKK